MGKMSLIKGQIRGKLGAMYGAKGVGKTVLKANPRPKANHNENQSNALILFGCLQRFCSPIAKNFFKYLGLSDYKMTKLNATTKLMKAMIAGKDFLLTNIKKIAYPKSPMIIETAKLEKSTMIVTVNTHESGNAPYQIDAQIYFGVYDETGTNYGYFTERGLPPTFKIELNKNVNQTIFLVGFRTYKENKKTMFADGLVFEIEV